MKLGLAALGALHRILWQHWGHLVGIGKHVIQFAQLSGLGGFKSFSSGGPFYIMTCPTGNEDGLFLFLVGRMSFVVEKKFAQPNLIGLLP